MSEIEDKNSAEQLRRLVETIDVANVLIEPLTESIENILQISAAEMCSDEASVLIRDGNEGDLKFLSAIGSVAEQLLKLKIPAGKGIAGFVMSSGQPMAVADVGGEESFYAEVDKTTGYSTQTILATPLRYKGEIIGVLEYVNRCGEPPYEPFTPQEMDKAALFAETISPLINAYESAKLFRELSDRMLTAEQSSDIVDIRKWLANLRESVEHKEMMDLAILVREISNRGEAERTMCREIMETVLKFADNKHETSFLGY